MDNFETIYEQHGTDYMSIDLNAADGRAYITYAQMREGMETRSGDVILPPASHFEAMAEVKKYHR